MRDLRAIFVAVLVVIFSFDEGWTLQYVGDPSQANLTSSYGVVSAPVALSVGDTENYWSPHQYPLGYLEVPQSMFPVGVPQPVRAWVRGDLAEQESPICVLVANGGADFFLFYVEKNDLLVGGSAFELVDFGTFTPTEDSSGWTIFVGILKDLVYVTEDNAHGRWTIDDLEIGEPVVTPEGDDMAVMLAEFAVRSVMAKALSTLNAEIANVKAEAATGIDLPLFTAWRGYDCGSATPDVTEFEVFEIGDTTFPSEEYDQSTWQAGARTRTISKTPMRAAINHANRGNADAVDATLLASQMAERSRLYGAALYRCFRNDPTCGQGVIVSIIPRAVRYNVRAPSRITTDVRRADRVEFDFDVFLRETSTGETIAGGASLPTASLETP